MANLEHEGIAGEVHLVGDVMADVSLAFRAIAEERSHILEEHSLGPGSYLLVTAHRAEHGRRPGATRPTRCALA